MNNLTTRKIVLGMLMTLVLGFGVQGVVEAISFPTTSHSHKVDYTTMRQVNSRTSVGSTISLNDSNDQEAVTIELGSGVALVSPFASTAGATVVLTEIAHNDSATTANGRFYVNPTNPANVVSDRTASGVINVGSSFTITVRFTIAGEQTVRIEDTTSQYTTDGTTNDDTRQNQRGNVTYTFYVVQQVGSDTSVTLTDGTGALSNGYSASGDFGEYPKQIVTGDSAVANQNLVTYTVTGGGRVYIERDATPTRPRIVGSPTTSLTTSRAFNVILDQNGSSADGTLGYSNMVTAKVSGTDTPTITGVYIHGSATLEVDAPEGASETGSQEKPGKAGQVIQTAFTVKVKDARGRGIPGAVVRFGPTAHSTSGNAQGTLIFSSRNSGILVEPETDRFDSILDSSDNPLKAGSAQTLYVRTNNSGTASVGYEFGDDGTQTIPVNVVDTSNAPFSSLTETITVYAGSKPGLQLSILRSRSSVSETNTFELYALVEEDGARSPNQAVTFNTQQGTLEDTVHSFTASTTVPNEPSDFSTAETGPRVKEYTNNEGIAEVKFNWDGTSNPKVTASIAEDRGGVMVPLQTVTFNILSGRSSDPPPPPPTTPARLDISVFGDDGDTSRAVIVNALNSAGQAVSISIPITLSGTALVTSQSVNTGAVTTITPPTDPDTYTLIATDPAGNYASDTETITVGGPAGEGTLDVTTVGDPVNNQQTIEVTVEDADGDAPTGEVVVTLTGPGISRTVDTLNGTGRAIITLPTTGTTYTLRLSADGYATREVTLSVSGVVQDDTETQTRDTTPIGGARRVRMASEPFPSGTANRQLAQPLRVQVLDANNRGVASVRVTFEVVSGQGRLSQRGNGRAIRAQTDSSGNASANYTPLADGTSRVRATAAGVTQTVTFTITAGAAAPSPDDTTPSDTGVTPSREINPGCACECVPPNVHRCYG